MGSEQVQVQEVEMQEVQERPDLLRDQPRELRVQRRHQEVRQRAEIGLSHGMGYLNHICCTLYNRKGVPTGIPPVFTVLLLSAKDEVLGARPRVERRFLIKHRRGLAAARTLSLRR